MLTDTMTISSAVPVAAPAVLPDFTLYEILDTGELVERNVGAKNAVLANVLADRINTSLTQPIRGRAFVEVLFRMTPPRNRAFQPDVAFVSFERWKDQTVADTDAWEMVPELVVEIVSKNNSAIEVRSKVHEYLAAGVKQVWEIYPGLQQIVVSSDPRTSHTLHETDVLEAPEIVPGFRMIVGELLV